MLITFFMTLCWSRLQFLDKKYSKNSIITIINIIEKIQYIIKLLKCMITWSIAAQETFLIIIVENNAAASYVCGNHYFIIYFQDCTKRINLSINQSINQLYWPSICTRNLCTKFWKHLAVSYFWSCKYNFTHHIIPNLNDFLSFVEHKYILKTTHNKSDQSESITTCISF